MAYAALQPNTSILRYKEKICQLLLFACKKAYRKHVSDDPSIGWDELGDILCDALCNAMGSDEFVKWNESYSQGFHY